MDTPYQVNLLRPHASLGYLLHRASKLGMARSEAVFDNSEISFTQWTVLALVYSRTATSCAELSRELDHNSGAMTRVIDQLQQRGLLARRPEAEDRRVTRLSVTPEGRAIVTDLAARISDLWNCILRDFSDSELANLLALLGRIVARLEAGDAQTGH